MKILLILVSAIILLGGCLSAAKKFQKQTQEHEQICNQCLLEHPCPPLFPKSDTITIVDSSAYIEYAQAIADITNSKAYHEWQLDSTAMSLTGEFNDVIDSLLKSKPGAIVKKFFIHDTVTDKRTEESLRKALNDSALKIARITGESSGTQIQHDKQIKSVRKSATWGWVVSGIEFLVICLLVYSTLKNPVSKLLSKS